MGLPFHGFLGIHDEIVDAHLFDEGHDFLTRARADGQHGHDGGHTEEHGEERAHAMKQQVLNAQLRVS